MSSWLLLKFLFYDFFSVDGLHDSIHISLLYDFWCPGMTCYYIKSQMQDNSCTILISRKIHEALEVWIGTWGSSMLDHNIPGSIPMLVLPQSLYFHQSYRTNNFTSLTELIT